MYWYVMVHACTNYSICMYFTMMDAYPAVTWYLIALKCRQRQSTAHVFVANQDHNMVEKALLDLKAQGVALSARSVTHKDIVIVDPCEWVLSCIDYTGIDKYYTASYNLALWRGNTMTLLTFS